MQSENQFVVDLLTTLRKGKFSPLGWWRFLKHAWEMSWNTAQAHPTLKRSWAYITSLIGIVALAMFLTSLYFEGLATALRLLPGVLFCVVWQQSDLFWHLGLNRQPQSGKLLPTIGIANTCTWLRGLAASYLLGRLVGGIPTPSWLALLVFLAGIVTDILDGQIAHFTQTQSKLGQIADGEADFCLYSALAFILLQNGILPLWLGLVIVLRFVVPLLAAAVSYFLFAHPIHFGSTVWGKYAGLAQCFYFLVLLAPTQLTFITRYLNMPLLIVTLILLVAAPVAQIVENIGEMSGRRSHT